MKMTLLEELKDLLDQWYDTENMRGEQLAEALVEVVNDYEDQDSPSESE